MSRPADEKPRLLVLAGPTGAGKSAAALEIAERYGAVVLSADAMQVYRGMDVGTGKATPAERARVRHFGIDVVDPREPFGASDFVRLGDAVVAEHSRVVVAGGTSLYVRSLIRGLVKTPPADEALRRELEALPDPYGELARVDPALALRLHPNDLLRIVRGLEVYRTTGQRLSELHRAHEEAPDRYEAEAVWLDRTDLDARIDARVVQMIADGYVAEVQRLLDAGYERALKPMLSLGYRHLCDHLLDGLPLDEAIRRTQRDSRGFARKQRNWMKSLGYPQLVDDHRAVHAAAERAWGSG